MFFSACDYWFAASTVSNGFERAVQPSLLPLSRWVCIVCIGLKREKNADVDEFENHISARGLMYVPFPESMRTLQDSVLKTAVLISSLYTAALAKVGVIALRSRSWKGHWPMDLSIVKWVGDDMRKMWAGGSGKYAKMSNSLNGSNEFHSRSSSRSLGRCHAGWCCSSSDCSDSGWGTGLRDNEKTSENLGQPVTGADHAATFESALQLQHVTRTRNHWCGHGDVAWSEVWHVFFAKRCWQKIYFWQKRWNTQLDLWWMYLSGFDCFFSGMFGNDWSRNLIGRFDLRTLAVRPGFPRTMQLDTN